MTNVINFDKVRIQKLVKENINEKDTRYEILLSVLRYVYAYIDAEYKYPTQHIKLTDETIVHFEGNEEKFVLALKGISDYWGMAYLPEFEQMNGELFTKFPTINDVAHYVLEFVE